MRHSRPRGGVPSLPRCISMEHHIKHYTANSSAMIIPMAKSQIYPKYKQTGTASEDSPGTAQVQCRMYHRTKLNHSGSGGSGRHNCRLSCTFRRGKVQPDVTGAKGSTLEKYEMNFQHRLCFETLLARPRHTTTLHEISHQGRTGPNSLHCRGRGWTCS